MEDESEPARAGMDDGCVGESAPEQGGVGGGELEVRPEDDGWRASPTESRVWMRWPSSAEKEVVRRVAAGESVLSICRDPTMPRPSTIAVWLRKRPAFRAALADARAEAGRLFGPPSTYCQETAEIIFQRLCAGQGLSRICQEDPTLPGVTTVYSWLGKHEEFRAAVALAREIAADYYFDKGWELAEGATRETAYLADVQLKHLRWHAGKLSPRKFGGFRPQDPAPPHDEDDRNNLTVVLKRYNWDGTPVEGPEAREQVLYRMKMDPPTPAQKRAAAREEAEERRREAEAQRPAAAALPEKPWDPEGWT